MKKLAILILILIPILIFADNKAIYDYPLLPISKDSDGNDIMGYNIPVEGKLEKAAFCSGFPRLAIYDEKNIRIFDTHTLELVTELKIKGIITDIVDSGYFVIQEAQFPSMSNYQISFYNLAGKQVWKNKDWPILKQANVLIKAKSKNKFIGSAMSTNQKLWEKTLPCKTHNISCEHYAENEDSNYLYIIGDSLVRINVLTGDTIMRSFCSTAIPSLGKLIGIDFSNPLGPYNLDLIKELKLSGIYNEFIAGLHSNWIVRGDSMIIADANNLYCFDKDFKTIWQTTLPQKMGAKSRIKLIGDHIQFLNYGIGFARRSYFSHGKPFGATFSVSDGKQLSFTLPTIKNKIMGGLYTDSGKIYFQTRKGFFYCDENDSILHKVEWTPQRKIKSEEMFSNNMICDSVCIVKDGLIQTIKTDDKQLIVQIDKSDVNVINMDGNCQLIPSDEVYFHTLNNIYATNGNQNGRRNFIIVEPNNGKVKYKFSIKKGVVMQDDDGNIILCTQQSVFFKKSDKTEK